MCQLMDSGLSSEVWYELNACTSKIELLWGSTFECEVPDVTLPRKSSSV